MTDDSTESRVSGDAAWQADREATYQRNAAVKRRAQEHTTASAVAAAERERRLLQREVEQLRALNKRLGARTHSSA